MLVAGSGGLQRPDTTPDGFERSVSEVPTLNEVRMSTSVEIGENSGRTEQSLAEGSGAISLQSDGPPVRNAPARTPSTPQPVGLLAAATPALPR